MAALTQRSLRGLGNSENVWDTVTFRSLNVATLTPERVVLIAPHPDDEVLGAGGTVATLAAAGAEVLLIAVTDGEASHRDRGEELRRVRPRETEAALEVLGLGNATVLRLQHPDGGVDADRLAMVLRRFLRPGDLVLAPWSREGHPDHDLVGRVCEETTAVLDFSLWSYLVWTWHWAHPGGSEVPWERAVRIELTPGVRETKSRAIDCFDSQINGVAPILAPHVLARFHRPYEVFLT